MGALNSMMSMEDAVLEVWMDTCEYHIAHLDTIKELSASSGEGPDSPPTSPRAASDTGV